MKKTLPSLCPLAILLANACAMSALFTVFSLVEGMDKSDPCLALWLCCLSACYLGLGLFLRRVRSVRAAIYFCAFFFFAQLVLAFVLRGVFSSLVGILAAVCMWLYTYFNCFELRIKKVAVERYTKSFDLCSLVLMFVLFFCSVKKLPFALVLPLALSSLLCLLAQVLVRGGESRKLRGLVISGALLLCMAAVAAAFVALASGGIEKLLSAFLSFVSAVLAFIYRCINGLFLFLMRFMPEKDYSAFAPPEIAGIDTSGAEQQALGFVDPEKFYIAVLCIGLAVAAALILHRIVRGKNELSALGDAGDTGLHRRKSGFVSAVKKSAARLVKAFRFKLDCLLLRNTAPGLLMQIEAQSKSTLHGRAEGESCREFLGRACEAYPQASAELMQLADILDSLYFGAGDTPPASEIASLRKHIFSVEN